MTTASPLSSQVSPVTLQSCRDSSTGPIFSRSLTVAAEQGTYRERITFLGAYFGELRNKRYARQVGKK